MKISIITASFNRERTIGDTIESVLSQDYSDIEYIIIDGASKDGTMAVVEKYRDKIAHVVSEKDSGMYEGINKGIALATGDVIGLLHSDDIFYASDTISRIAKEFKRTRAQFVYGNGIFVKQNNKDSIVRDWISGFYTREKVQRGWLPLHTSVFVRREVIEKCGNYDQKYKISADSEWLLRCLYDNDLRVSYINEYIVCMRMGGYSTNFSMTKRKWREDLQLYHQHGLSPYFSLFCKIMQKVPQFAKAWMRRRLK